MQCRRLTISVILALVLYYISRLQKNSKLVETGVLTVELSWLGCWVMHLLIEAQKFIAAQAPMHGCM